MSSKMSIEEVDDILRIGEPQPKTLAYIVIGVMMFFWTTGIYVLYMVLSGFGPELGAIIGGIAGILGQYQILVALVVIFAFMFVVAFLYLYLVYKLAREILMALFIIIGVGALILGGVIIFFVQQMLVIGVISLVIGVGVLIFFAIFKKRISLAGRMIELSAKAVIDEKGILSMVIVKAIIIAWTVLSWIASLFFWTFHVLATFSTSQHQTVIAAVTFIVIFFMGLWTNMFLDSFFNAAIVRIVHDWYRSPEVDVASFNKGIKKAWEVAGNLAKYALFFAMLSLVIHMARSYAKKGKGVGAFAARIVAWVFQITEDIIRFLGFYMIPAMVIRKAGFRKSLEDSVHKLRDLFIETLAGMFGFEIVLGIIALIVSTTFGVVGYFVGIFVFAPFFGIPAGSKFLVGIISAFAFFVLSLIPIGIATSAVSVSWKTILYEYGLDIEFAMRGTFLPARLPSDVKEVFRETLEKKGVVIPEPRAVPAV